MERAAHDPAEGARGALPRERGVSIRTLAALWAGSLAALVLATALALAVTAGLVRNATEAVTRETQALALTSAIEVDATAYRRLVEMGALLPGRGADPEIVALRGQLREQLGRAARLARTERQRELAEEASLRLEAYLAACDRLETAPDLEPAIRTTRPHFARLLAGLEALRTLGGAEVDRAHDEVIRLTRASYAGGAVVVALLLIALGVVGRRVQDLLVGPLLDLHGAIRRFREGDTAARAPIAGPREVAELTAAFDDMADAIARQRDAQLSFLAGVAHDLRNPLSAMRLGVHVLERDPSGPARHRTLALLQRQIGGLSRMVEDLLDATRIEAGRLELHRRVIDVRDAARETIELYAPSAASHEIALELPREPLLVDADPVRIEQVLGNLVSNAIKFSPAGGEVIVRGRRAGDHAVLEVIDHGIGIAKDALPDLFAPFRRRAPEVAPGAGLGLSVVRRIVVAHGGTIEVESAPHAGSTFRVSLPLASTAASPAEEAQPGPALRGSPA